MTEITDQAVFNLIPDDDCIGTAYIVCAIAPNVYGKEWIAIRRKVHAAILRLETQQQIVYRRGNGGRDDGYVRRAMA